MAIGSFTACRPGFMELIGGWCKWIKEDIEIVLVDAEARTKIKTFMIKTDIINYIVDKVKNIEGLRIKDNANGVCFYHSPIEFLTGNEGKYIFWINRRSNNVIGYVDLNLFEDENVALEDKQRDCIGFICHKDGLFSIGWPKGYY